MNAIPKNYPKDYIPLETVFNRAGIVFCSGCNQGYTDELNRQAIKCLGECLACDHIRLEREDYE